MPNDPLVPVTQTTGAVTDQTATLVAASDVITQGAEKLLQDLSLATIPESQKQELIGKITALVDQEVMYAIMSRLTDKDVDDLEQYLDEQSDRPLNEQAYLFLDSRLPNLQKIIEDALVAVYDRLKETNDILAS